MHIRKYMTLLCNKKEHRIPEYTSHPACCNTAESMSSVASVQVSDSLPSSCALSPFLILSSLYFIQQIVCFALLRICSCMFCLRDAKEAAQQLLALGKGRGGDAFSLNCKPQIHPGLGKGGRNQYILVNRKIGKSYSVTPRHCTSLWYLHIRAEVCLPL